MKNRFYFCWLKLGLLFYSYLTNEILPKCCIFAKFVFSSVKFDRSFENWKAHKTKNLIRKDFVIVRCMFFTEPPPTSTNQSTSPNQPQPHLPPQNTFNQHHSAPTTLPPSPQLTPHLPPLINPINSSQPKPTLITSNHLKHALLHI